MIVVAIIGLLAAIAVPSYVRARANSQAAACINNLRQIESAAQQFAIEKRLHTGDLITYPADILPFIKLNKAGVIPTCPASGDYSLLMVGASPQAICSLSNSVTPPHILE